MEESSFTKEVQSICIHILVYWFKSWLPMQSYSLIDKSLIMVLTWNIILLVMETPCSSPNKTHPLDPEKALLYFSRRSNLVETFIPAMLQLVVHPKNYYICNDFMNSHCPIFNNSHPWTHAHFDGSFFFGSILQIGLVIPKPSRI